MEQILSNIAAALPLLVPILYTLLVASGVDLLTGAWAAATSGTFRWEFVAEYIRSHIALKIGPILITLVAGVGVGGGDSAAGLALITAGGASAALYLASVVASVGGNLREGASHTKGLPTGIPPKADPTPTPPPA